MKNEYIWTLMTWVFCLEVFAQTPMTFGHQHSFYSTELGEERLYSVWLPEDYDSTTQYPTFYVLDGDEYFFLAASAVRYLSNRGFMPQTVVVGIDNSQNRDRDLTPTPSEWAPNGGGADKFHAFLIKELIPSIENTYPVAPHRTLFGASDAGLFVLYDLFSTSGNFDAYISISPSVYHDDKWILKRAIEYVQSEGQNEALLFMTLADEVYQELRIAFRDLDEMLKNQAPESLIVASRYYPEETHETTKMRGLNDGLRWIHHDWFLPFYQRERGLVGLKQHYDLLSGQYGYTIQPPFGSLVRAANGFIREQKFKKAETYFSYLKQVYPENPYTYYYLANFEKARKNKKAALDMIEEGLEKAKKAKLGQEDLLQLKQTINKQ